MSRKNGVAYITSDCSDPDWEASKALVGGGVDTSRLLELYYWSLEPGVVELARKYLAMPERARHALSRYLATAQPSAIAVATDADGRLILSQGNESARLEESWPPLPAERPPFS